MIDKNDNLTLSLPVIEEPSRPRGRPRQYSSAAERQRAYRARLKEKGIVEVRRLVSKRIPDTMPAKSTALDLSGNIAAALSSRGRR